MRSVRSHINNFPDGLALVASAPPQTSSQVIASAEWDDANSGLVDKGSFIYINSLIRSGQLVWFVVCDVVCDVVCWLRFVLRYVLLI